MTLPLRRHPEHTRTFFVFVVPATFAFTGCRFTFQRRRLLLFACETLLPNCGPLPQTEQTCAMTNSKMFGTAWASTAALGLRDREQHWVSLEVQPKGKKRAEPEMNKRGWTPTFKFYPSLWISATHWAPAAGAALFVPGLRRPIKSVNSRSSQLWAVGQVSEN